MSLGFPLSKITKFCFFLSRKGERGYFAMLSASFPATGFLDLIAHYSNYLSFYGSVASYLESGWNVSFKKLGYGYFYKIKKSSQRRRDKSPAHETRSVRTRMV